jgi:phage-related protein
MARGNTVELIFAGDSQQLERTFERVGSSSKDMATKVDRSSKDMTSSFDTVGGSVEGAETSFQNTANTINGTKDVWEGFRTGNVAQMATGFADLAQGLGQTFIPMLGKVAAKLGLTTLATNVMATATGALNTVMALNPITLVVIALAALAAAFVVAYKNSETFRNIVDGAVRAVGDAAIWVKDRFVDLWNFIKELPQKIVNAFKRVPGIIADIIPGGSVIESVVKKIPFFHDGGVVPGAAGQNVPAILQAGETVIPAGRKASGGTTVVVNVSGVGMGRDFGDAVARALRDNRLIGVTV